MCLGGERERRGASLVRTAQTHTQNFHANLYMVLAHWITGGGSERHLFSFFFFGGMNSPGGLTWHSGIANFVSWSHAGENGNRTHERIAGSPAESLQA